MRIFSVLLALPALASSCGYGFDAWFDGRCFKSWNYGQVFHLNAVQQCDQSNAYLPIIRSEEDNKRVYDMARKMTQGLGADTKFGFWLGLTCNGKDYVWQDGSVANYTNFDVATPCNPDTANKVFFFMTEDYAWNESGNTIFEWVVCEAKYPSMAKCDDFEKVPNSEDDCYLLKTRSASAYSAELGCNMDGSHLASIHDKNMNDFIRRTAVANGFINGMHIGLAQLDYMHYSWTDKSPVDYTNYGPGQPDDTKGGCVKLTTDTMQAPWVTGDCVVTALPYFCSKKAVILNDPPQPAGCPANAQFKAGDHIYSPSFPSPGGASLSATTASERLISRRRLSCRSFSSSQISAVTP